MELIYGENLKGHDLKDPFIQFAMTLRTWDLVTQVEVNLDLWGIRRTRHASLSPRDILIKGRMCGFTTWEIARSIWYAETHPRSYILTLAVEDAKGAHTRLVAEHINRLLGTRRHWIRKDETRFEDPRTNSLINVMAVSSSPRAIGKIGHGRRIDRLHVCEAAYHRPGIDDAMNTLFACCAPASEIVFETSVPPEGDSKSSFFCRLYADALHGKNDYRVHVFGGPVPPITAFAGPETA